MEFLPLSAARNLLGCQSFGQKLPAMCWSGSRRAKFTQHCLATSRFSLSLYPLTARISDPHLDPDAAPVRIAECFSTYRCAELVSRFPDSSLMIYAAEAGFVDGHSFAKLRGPSASWQCREKTVRRSCPPARMTSRSCGHCQLRGRGAKVIVNWTGSLFRTTCRQQGTTTPYKFQRLVAGRRQS